MATTISSINVMPDAPLSRRQFGSDDVADLAAYRRSRQPVRRHPIDMSPEDMHQHIQQDHGVYVDDEMAGPLMMEQMHADLHRSPIEHVPAVSHTHERP